MNSIDLIRQNLTASRDRVLARIEEMREHCFVAPTPQGGAHTLWVLGHLATIEGHIIRELMRGEPNPLDHWRALFDGDEVSMTTSDDPGFDEVLDQCQAMRADTLTLIDAMTEADLDQSSAVIAPGFEDWFGTARHCLQFVADHWYMHRGQLADARRAAGLARMGV